MAPETGGGNPPKRTGPNSKGKKGERVPRERGPDDSPQDFTAREARQARKALLGTSQDPLAGGLELAKIGGFYEGGLGRMAQYDRGDGTKTYTTPEMQAALGRYKQYSDQYANGGRTADTSDLISRYKAGLEGYSSAESQGFREQAQRGIDQQMRTQLGALRTSQARGGVRGASAAAQQANLDKMRMGEQQNLEQDLFVRNADEKQRRLQAYGDTLRGVEGEEYGRQMQSQNAYAAALGGQEQSNRESSKYDLDRLMAEKSGAMSSVLTAADLAQQERNTKRKLDLWNQALRRNRSGPAL